jgi:hypothetical protein
LLSLPDTSSGRALLEKKSGKRDILGMYLLDAEDLAAVPKKTI